jgi:DNA invertase Pin-like site-specific DNA recombinase
MRKPLRAATQYIIGYARKSTDTEDKQVHSLDDQETLIRTHFARLDPQEQRQHPLLLLREAVSAYRPGRPVFNRIMSMADHGQVYGLIAVHPNRISRNHGDSGGFTQRLVDRTIHFLDVTAGKRYTAENSNDIFMLNLEGAMSWKDSRDKGDRILQAMRLRATEGKHMGPVRIGYRSVYRPDGRPVLEVVPDAAAVIRRLFELAGAGSMSLRELTVEARRLGLRSRNGKLVPLSNIHTLLRDPLYKGYIRFDGILARGNHEPIVAESLWADVQRVLTGRRSNTARPKDPGLRELFLFGSLLKCAGCGRSLCPYRAKGTYVYYECKNPDTDCRICVSQPAVVKQLPILLERMAVDAAARDTLRADLLRQYAGRGQDRAASTRVLKVEYETIVKEINDVFAHREEARKLGILDAVDQRLGELRQRKEEVSVRLNGTADDGTGWVEDSIRCFELFELLQEAIFYGSRPIREALFIALFSNFSVEGKNLCGKPRSPFRESEKKGVVREWWSSLDDVRTEIRDTFGRLEAAFVLFQHLQNGGEIELSKLG